MDDKKFLVLIRIKGKWQDKTSSIITVSAQGNVTNVQFTNRRTYPYKSENVNFFDEPEVIDLSQNIITFTNHFEVQNFSEAIIFDDYICLFNNGKKKLLKRQDVKIEQNIACQENSKKLISYYTSIADLIEETGSENEKSGMAHLSYYYHNKLNQILPDTVLDFFISGSTPVPSIKTKPVIFPFGINESQLLAVNRALKSKISLIQGPPGTGKTQTILNIIANLVMHNKTVAVVAGNNSAVENVYEKLEKEQLGFIAAKLGNNEVVSQFLEQEHPVPDLSLWELPKKERKILKEKLLNIDKNIDTLLKDNNNLAKEKDFLRRLELEENHFKNNFKHSPFEISKCSLSNNWNTPNLLRFIADFQYCSKHKNLNLFTKFLWLVKYRIYKFEDLNDLSEDTFKKLVSEYYLRRIIESKKMIKSLERRLDRKNFKDILDKKTKYSKRLFKDSMALKFSQVEQKEFNKNSYKRHDFQEFIERFPVVMSTTDSVINNKPNLELFDYVIVDEASQVNLLAGFLTMSCAKNIVVVGDLKQLPHIPAKIEQLDDLAEQYNISLFYNYEHENLLSSLDKIFHDVPKTLLKEHYRCHPKIIDYCNQKFYDGKLIIMTESKEEPFNIIKTVKGNHAAKPPSGKGYINHRELDVIEKEVLPEESRHTSMENIGIISPYRSQANHAQVRWKEKDIEADTVHKFQGREKGIIIFSGTTNKINEFIDNPKLLNVTVSRAINRFVMILSPRILKQQGTNIGDLIRHIEYQSASPEIVESKVVSIFDCLYSEFSHTLNEFRSKVERRSFYLSEDLVSVLLDDLLAHDQYASFSYHKNYSLKLLVADDSLLTQEEKMFISRSSHIDFLIYNKLDKIPVLAIEVDGYSTHTLNEKQLERDEIKDSILEKILLPLERFSTKGSDEKVRLDKILSHLIEL